MTDTSALESRVARLEAALAELRKAFEELRQSLPQPAPPKPELRSRGMLDRPRK
jgi:hypothetical protein